MRIKTLKGLVGVLVLASTALVVSGCNTSKATVDTFAKFTSSTSPEEWLSDGVIPESKKARLFTAITFENLEQDIARGNGEYLTSLAMLLKIPAGMQDEFMARSQRNYSPLFAPDLRTAEKLLAALTSKREDLRVESRQSE